MNKKGNPSGVQQEAIVLSYSHTVSAAVQILDLTEESVKQFGESSTDLKQKITSQYGSDKWKQVQDKSLANEKSHNAQERQKELQKQQANINRATEKLLGLKCGANVPKQKASKPPKAAKKTSVANSDDQGWTKVSR